MRPTLAHGVMVLAGLATFVLVASALAQRSATVDVLVAGGGVQVGTPVEEAPLVVAAVDADSPLLDSLVRVGEAEPGRRVGRSLQPGEPLLRTDVVAGGDGNGLRTVALPVERLVLDGLGLGVGDRVDVIAAGTDGAARFVAVDVGVVRLPGEAALGLGRSVETATTWLTVGVSDAQALDLAAALGQDRLVVARSTGAAPVLVPVGASLGVAVEARG